MEYTKNGKIRTCSKELTVYSGKLKHIDFISNDGLFMIQQGLMIVRAGYQWNGCDFVRDVKKTDRGGAIHDALIKYMVPISNKLIDEVFYDVLKEDCFPLAYIYYLAVRGASKFNGRRLHGI